MYPMTTPTRLPTIPRITPCFKKIPIISDGKTDLAIGSYLSSSSTGRAYIFMTEAKAEEALLQLQSIGVTNIIGNFEVR
jgi:hypothetical protein